MQDRNVQWPNRYQLTKVPGTDDIYDLTPAPGTITAEGTMINKATMLQDLTCDVLGLPHTAVPNDAFFRLALPPGKYSVKVTVLSPGGIPLPGIAITGITTLTGDSVITGSDGTALGLSDTQNTTLTATNKFIDINGNVSLSVSLEPETINYVTLQFSRISGTSTTISSSQVIQFSPDVSDFDCSAIGGGQNGENGSYGPLAGTSGAYYAQGGKGGDAGAIVNMQGIQNDGKEIEVQIGAAGGNTTVGDFITTTSAVGARGGTGAYCRSDNSRYNVDGLNGEDSASFLHPPTTVGGAGGGGAARTRINSASNSAKRGLGGQPGGGNGGDDSNGNNGSYPGSGGGGGYGNITDSMASPTSGGVGSPGLVGFVWRYAS